MLQNFANHECVSFWRNRVHKIKELKIERWVLVTCALECQCTCVESEIVAAVDALDFVLMRVYVAVCSGELQQRCSVWWSLIIFKQMSCSNS